MTGLPGSVFRLTAAAPLPSACTPPNLRKSHAKCAFLCPVLLRLEFLFLGVGFRVEFGLARPWLILLRSLAQIFRFPLAGISYTGLVFMRYRNPSRTASSAARRSAPVAGASFKFKSG